MVKVKVQARKFSKHGKVYKTLYVAIPAAFTEVLRINEGDIINCTLMDVNLDGKTARALVYYKD